MQKRTITSLAFILGLFGAVIGAAAGMQIGLDMGEHPPLGSLCLGGLLGGMGLAGSVLIFDATGSKNTGLVTRLFHHLCWAIYGAGIAFWSGGFLAGLFMGDDSESGLVLGLFVYPISAVIGALSGLLFSWQLLKRAKVSQGDELSWWRSQPIWMKLLVLVLAIPSLALVIVLF